MPVKLLLSLRLLSEYIGVTIEVTNGQLLLKSQNIAIKFRDSARLLDLGWTYDDSVWSFNLFDEEASN